MDKIPKLKVLFFSIIVLILILVIFNIRLEYLKNQFKRDCKVTYNVNDSCPCEAIKSSKYVTIPDNFTIKPNS